MTIKGKRLSPLALILGALGVILMAQLAIASHPRPKGATPVRVSLVPAYDQCTSPNNTHGPPLVFGSCSPPQQASDFLTVGTPDANGARAKSEGFVQLRVFVGSPGPPDDSSVILEATITDVRCKPGTTACGNANTADGPDYTGELEGNATIRITDHFNGRNRDEPATVQDIPLPFTLHCVNTADTSIGGFCRFPVAECLECPPPKEGVRTVVEIAQIQIRDGGPDGVAATQDNTLFMNQGIFIP
jgi:hypothetical protein